MEVYVLVEEIQSDAQILIPSLIFGCSFQKKKKKDEALYVRHGCLSVTYE
jgi:diphthamide synthase subunit DPH2